MRAPPIRNVDCVVVAHDAPTPRCRRLRLRAPAPLRSLPGQFLHVRCAGEADTEPLLRRPFSVYTEEGRDVEILYTIVGAGTARLARLRPGDRVRVLGPLGTCFPAVRGPQPLILVAGGVGIVPFLHYVRSLPRRRPPLILLFGGRSREYLHDLGAWASAGVDVRIATEDGSLGLRGTVVDLLRRVLREAGARRPCVFTCGPDAMMRAVIRVCRRRGLACWASLERRMGCALGACGACATPVREGRSWRYSRICVEGPVYDTRRLILNGR